MKSKLSLNVKQKNIINPKLRKQTPSILGPKLQKFFTAENWLTGEEEIQINSCSNKCYCFIRLRNNYPV